MASAGLWTFQATLGALLYASASVLTAQAFSELRGRVVDAQGRPIPGASVTLSAIGYSVRTDSAGAFRLTGTPGSMLLLSIAAGGYRVDTASVVLARGKTVTRDFLLASNDSPPPEANPSQRVLRGRVTDRDGMPLAYANVQINGGRRLVTDDTGRFTLPITVSGRFTLLVRRIGFEPEELKLDSMPDTAIAVRMKAVAHALPEQRVTSGSPFVGLDIHGFYRRMADVERGVNHGYFITPEDLAFRRPLNATDAVGGIPTIRVRPIPGAKLPLARLMRIEGQGGCPMTVYLDRIRIQPAMIRGEWRDELINELVQTGSVAGIEVYPRAVGAPPEFQANNGTCGIVLIWTK
ncbi:MAG TPA: carboxypeptidase regulatory-like domain-containing protein [Gemmatimonadaceae bacterium]